jgi:hypothetical protein
MHNHANQEQTDQLRSDIDSSLLELEQLQQNYTQYTSGRTSKNSRSQSSSPIRTHSRSLSADDQRQRRSITPKVSFQDDPIIEKSVMFFFFLLFSFLNQLIIIDEEHVVQHQ